MSIFFCYERAMTGNWQPVCYHGERPKDVKVSDGDAPFRLKLTEVPPDCMDMENEPNLGRLVKRFPLEVEE